MYALLQPLCVCKYQTALISCAISHCLIAYYADVGIEKCKMLPCPVLTGVQVRFQHDTCSCSCLPTYA